jgi:hypothetical protein
MYNKFRAVSSILVIAEFTIPLLAIFALKEILNKPDTLKLKENRGGVIATLVLTAGVALILAVAPGVSSSSFVTAQEIATLEQVLPAESRAQHLAPIVANLTEMRKAVCCFRCMAQFLYYRDRLRAFILYQQRKLKASFTLAGIALLCLIDMWSINKRYLNDEQFVPKSKQTEAC